MAPPPYSGVSAERLDAYMARANADYYASCDPFADFTTAPEITQVFGELLGAWAAIVWVQMGRPDPVLLVEAGPGRGTLMSDALRAIRQVAPDFAAAARLHLIETSPRLRAIQHARLPQASWHDTLASLPDGPTLLIANELLDALPIRQFVHRPDGWKERHVADHAFVEHPCDPPPGALTGTPDGTIVEWGEVREHWCRDVAQRITQHGGAALLLDYGPATSAPGDSLQALRHGQPVDPLADSGTADLTAHVDFAAIAEVARSTGATVHGPLAQGALLERLGLYPRFRRLAAALPPSQALAMMEAAQRLAQPERMGALFKALAICHPALPTPPGYE